MWGISFTVLFVLPFLFLGVLRMPVINSILLGFGFFFFFCSEFCHTLKWNSHGFTCVPHPDPPTHLPLHPLPLGLPSAPGPSACLMHPTWAGDLFHPRYIHVSMLFSWTIPPLPSSTESKRLFYKSVFFFCSAYRVII